MNAHSNIVKLVARTSDRGQKIWKWGDRLVIRGNAAGNRERPARLTLELEGHDKVVVTLTKGMTPEATLLAINTAMPPMLQVETEMLDDNALALRVRQRTLVAVPMPVPLPVETPRVLPMSRGVAA